VIEMSWLPGVPLDDTPLSAAHTDALALALDRLWNAVPHARLTDLGGPGLNVSQLAQCVTDMVAAHRTVDDCALVRRAWQAAADAFLAVFGLTAAEQVKVREYRRLAALFWLMMLLPGSPAHHRNPPGTLERQAARLLLLLDCGG
jgi:hypothetical protein